MLMSPKLSFDKCVYDLTQEKDENEINLDLFMSVVSFLRFQLNFEVVKNISTKFGNYGNDLYAIFVLYNTLESYLLLGNQKLQVQKRNP